MELGLVLESWGLSPGQSRCCEVGLLGIICMVKRNLSHKDVQPEYLSNDTHHMQLLQSLIRKILMKLVETPT